MEERTASLPQEEFSPRGPLRQRLPNHKKRQENLFVASILALPIACFLVFWVYVNFDSLLLSFQQERYGVDGAAMELVFTLDNFARVFAELASDGSLLIASRNTVLFYAVGLVIVLPVSVLMAYFVYKKIPGHKVFRTVTYLPNIICSSALVILFQYTFMSGSPYEALMNALGSPYENPLVTDSAIVLLLVYNVIFGFGPNMVVLGGAMNAISGEVLEAGEIDGCTWFKELVYLIVPMIWPTISTILILSMAGILGSTGPILAMTGGEHNTQSLAFLLYAYATGVVGTIPQDIYYASALGLVMTIITFPIVLLMRWLLNRRESV